MIFFGLDVCIICNFLSKEGCSKIKSVLCGKIFSGTFPINIITIKIDNK